MQLFLRIFSGMANSVDPDQTAPSEQSDLDLHCLHMSETLVFVVLGHLP